MLKIYYFFFSLVDGIFFSRQSRRTDAISFLPELVYRCTTETTYKVKAIRPITTPANHTVREQFLSYLARQSDIYLYR